MSFQKVCRGENALTTKDAVLEQLIKSGGNHLSGAKLAQELCLSRTAVWKAIEELRRDGYQISAVTNRGYTLIEIGRASCRERV